MSTKVLESTYVCPAEDTPKEPLWLASIDLIPRSVYSHTRVLFVYNEPNNISHNSKSSFFDTNILKESLSKALVPFYPMAGRLQTNNKTGRIEIDCNAKGITFVEAETTHMISDFGDFKPSAKLRDVAFPKCDYDGGLSSFPLLLIQLTRFKCGGVTLGYMQHHHVADGASHVHFITSWARLSMGLELDVMPFHDRYGCLKPRNPIQIKFQHLEYEPPLPPIKMLGDAANTKEGVFELSIKQINALKQAMSQNNEMTYISTFEVLAGHVWRTVCKARGLTDDQDVKLYIPSDGRSRLNPPLPQGYCGNVIFFTACIAVDYLESQPDLTALVRGAHTNTCPNFAINSWLKLPFNESDFGWGGPTMFSHGGIRYEGQSCLLAGNNDDESISVVLKLYSLHMTYFEKYLYEI